jgi:hypothetical protein
MAIDSREESFRHGAKSPKTYCPFGIFNPTSLFGEQLMWKLSLILSAGLLMVANQASATIIAQDDFNYANGTLHGNGTAGAGWAGGWVLGTGSGVSVANGAVTNNTDNQRTQRNLTDTQGTDNTTVFIGFDHEFGTHFSAIEFNLGDANDTNFRLEFNNGFLSGSQFRAHAAGGDQIAVVNEAGIRRYVIEVDYGVGDADTATLYDNGAVVGSISTTSTGGLAFNQVSLGAFGGGILNFTDNLVIATTFNEAALIPEASSLAMLAFGAIGLWLFRRK